MLHIELRNIASMMVIAPLSANTMAKMSNGICDNLITNVFRCWPYQKAGGGWLLQKPVVVAPAMNTQMYEHPITEKQLHYLESELSIQILGTETKTLMCNETGSGAMASVDTIVLAIKEHIDNEF